MMKENDCGPPQVTHLGAADGSAFFTMKCTGARLRRLLGGMSVKQILEAL